MLANRSSGGREAHSRCAVYAVTADTRLPVIWCSFSAGPEGEWWERLQRRATWRGGQDGHSDDARSIRSANSLCQREQMLSSPRFVWRVGSRHPDVSTVVNTRANRNAARAAPAA